MIQTLEPGIRSGSIRIPASKSQAHRLLICAALSKLPSQIHCDGISEDIAATMDCLSGMGASLHLEDNLISVLPQQPLPSQETVLSCRESGSTLRFLLPLVGALGISGCFDRKGRLAERPLAPLDEQLTLHGMNLTPEGSLLHVSGQLQPGSYQLPGNVSSQYISGLLFALPLLSGDSTLEVTGTIESKDYIAMTEDALRLSGIHWEKDGSTYRIPGNQSYQVPQNLEVEGDWSNAAFFLCCGALSPKGVLVQGLNPASSQGDRRILPLLRTFGAQVQETPDGIRIARAQLNGCTIDASLIPDLVPVLSVVAAFSEGTTIFTHAERLRIKESDRIQSTAELLRHLGAQAEETADGLRITGQKQLSGGCIDSFHDHRIAMSAAVASCGCLQEVTVQDADCIRKSYPRFWDDFASLEVSK